jgi:hypothetical protein
MLLGACWRWDGGVCYYQHQYDLAGENGFGKTHCVSAMCIFCGDKESEKCLTAVICTVLSAQLRLEAETSICQNSKVERHSGVEEGCGLSGVRCRHIERNANS